MTERRKEADRDGCLGALLRWTRHPLRAFAMGAAAFCLIADIALTPGIVAAVLGAMAGVFAGELLGKSRLRLSFVLGGLAALAGVTLLLGGAIVRVEALVRLFGTGGALEMVGFSSYGGIALSTVAAMRATARRHPSWQALELGFVVLAFAAALAAHRGGVIARPLWLSDWAWRRGMDPADLLIAIGVASALVAVSLLLFERKGRLSLAALPLLPVIAMLAVSCLDVTGVGPDRGEASPETLDEEGDEPENVPDDPNEDARGGRGGSDGGRPVDAGGSRRDGGSGGGGRDGGVADGGGGGGRSDGGRGGGGGGDGGADGGRSGGGRADGGGSRSDGGRGGGGDGDGGGGGGGSDGGAGGGGGDGGADDPWEGWDAGLDDLELPPPRNDGSGQGQSGGASDAEDVLEQPPPTGASAAAPAAVVLFERDYSPPSETYYFRQNAWSEFNGTRLVPTRLPEADRDLAPRYPAGRLPVEEPPQEGRLAVAATVALLSEHPIPFALESPVYFADARNPNPSRFVRAYRFLSRAQSAPYQELFGRRPGNPAWSDDLRRLYLQPHPDPRFREFAFEVVDEMPAARRSDPFARAVAIKLRLDEMLTYSTRERHADAEDPTVDFFFGNRIGYCVHFAHTAVFLYRAAGIPSRVGVGYASAEANRRGGSALLIKSGDAHAWPELYLEGIGWVVLDIAAHENLDPPGAPQDEDLQRLLGEMAREQPPDPEDEIPQQQEEESLLPPASMMGQALGVLFLLALGAILLFLYGVKAWRRIAPAVAGPLALPTAAFRLSLDRLSEAGLSREFGETREQFAARVGEVSPAFRRATELLLSAHLGAPRSREQAQLEVGRWREVTKAVRLELRGGTKWWRRLLGLLHPLAFLDSR